MTVLWPPNIGIEPYYQDKYRVIYHGDCLEIMPKLSMTVDMVLCDLPYGVTARNNRC